MHSSHRRRVVKFIGEALALPGENINKFLGGYNSNWGSSPPPPPSPLLSTPMTQVYLYIILCNIFYNY